MIDHVEALREFSAWRRGEGDSAKYDGIQKTLGISIDAVIAEMEKLRMEAEVSRRAIQKWAAERSGTMAEIERLRTHKKNSNAVIRKCSNDLAALMSEIDHLRKLATCGCGDEFTEHDPGTCGNCVAGMRK